MWEVILAGMSSGALSTIAGACLAWLNRKTDMANKLADQAHERNRWVHEAAQKTRDMEIAKGELDARERISMGEKDADFNSARVKAIADIEHADKVAAEEIKAAGGLGWLLVLVSASRRVVRPWATAWLLGSATLMSFAIIAYFLLNGGKLTEIQWFNLAQGAAAWVWTQAGICTGYWFMARDNTNRAVPSV